MTDRYLVTGCAGFIGAKVSELLLADGHEVVGLDNVNDAYDVRLKEWRLFRLREQTRFHFRCLDIADRRALGDLFKHYAKSRPALRENGPWECRPCGRGSLQLGSSYWLDCRRPAPGHHRRL